jgi:hypothetical protein
MRTALSLFILATLALGTSQPLIAGQTTKYGVTVRTVKASELAKAKTYLWRVGQPAFTKSTDDAIVAAVDRELAARGFTKVASGASDVTVSYASTSRTDVNTKNNPTTGAAPEFDVGILVVDLNHATSRDLLFRVRADAPIARDAAALEATINTVVTAMFEKYPSPAKR